MINFLNLEYFLVAAEELNFTKAAKKLFISQQSLSNHISNMEKEFDVIKPHKNKKGNRQFTKADIDNFHLIYHLVKEKGMTLRGAQMKLRESKAETEVNFEVVKRLKAIREELIQIKAQLS